MTAELQATSSADVLDGITEIGEREPTKHALPRLPYDYGDLVPCIDDRTMTVHHDLHHGTYVEKLNAALDKHPEFYAHSALWLLVNLDKVPEDIRQAVRQNAGGHVNHTLFWRAMKPAGGGEPKGELASAINRDFGSLDKFKQAFEQAGSKVFGSGWVWLACNANRKLEIVTTAGHDHPAMQGKFPVLLNDVWEHAYYLHYENQRGDYLSAWWSVVAWEEAERRFAMAAGAKDGDVAKKVSHKVSTDRVKPEKSSASGRPQ
jgi:superoxide dismutase, Fe-Mn family